MNEIRKFDFNGMEIRTQIVNGEPMFCLADVCKVLDLDQVSRVKSRLKEDGVTTGKVIDSMGRPQEATFITEQNLYKVIFQSRKPEAEAFTDWVTGEVLPEIRKNGGYMVSSPEESPEDIMARALKIADETIRRKEERLKAAEEKLAIAEPKAAFVDNFCVSRGTILVRDFAKHIAQALGFRGFGEKVLFAFFKENGYLNLNRYPTQYSTDHGLFKVYEGIHQHNDGSTGLHHCSRITPNCFYNPETKSCGTCENFFRNSADGITSSIPQCKEGLMKTDPNSKMNPWGMRTQCDGYVKKHENEM